MLEATWVNVNRTVTVLIMNVMNNVFQCSNEKEMRQFKQITKILFRTIYIGNREIFANDD